MSPQATGTNNAEGANGATGKTEAFTFGTVRNSRSALGPALNLTEEISADNQALVIGLIKADDEFSVILNEEHFDDKMADDLSAALSAVGATGKMGEINRIPAPAGLPVEFVLAVGLGTDAKAESAETIRRAAGIAARSLKGTASIVTTLSEIDLGAAAEGFYLGAYEFSIYRNISTPTAAPLATVNLLVEDSDDSGTVEVLRRSALIAEAVATAREFVNTPPNDLSPAEFASRAVALAEKAGVEATVLDEGELAEAGYGGIVSVGQGSIRPPRLVRLSYTAPQGASSTVALVGKGITFDTGGISIKPAASMHEMTSDMGGAAATVATVVLAAKLGLNINVIATVPMAENMPSGSATRPGDVITHYGGITSEVLNTDAEGRLVLADAIVRACEDKPDYLIDTATLTGAQLVALGSRTPGVLGTDDFRDRVAKISQEVGENGWAMPFPEELRADIDSRVADLANVAGHRFGGMLVAGLYLKEFIAPEVEWAHIDVAGPAYNSSGAWGYTGKGGTGVPVRTMIAVLEDIANSSTAPETQA